jgi:ribosomal protein L37E
METNGKRLDDFPAETFTICAFCKACGHQAFLERAAIPPDLPVQALPSHLRCTRCGARRTSIRILYTGAGGLHYGGAPAASG